MTAGRWDFILEQGATFQVTLTYKDSNDTAIDLTSYTARMKIKESHAESASLVELTTANGGITLGGVAGTIALLISDTDTTALDFDNGVHDLEIVSGSGIVTRIVEGNVVFSKEVTD